MSILKENLYIVLEMNFRQGLFFFRIVGMSLTIVGAFYIFVTAVKWFKTDSLPQALITGSEKLGHIYGLMAFILGMYFVMLILFGIKSRWKKDNIAPHNELKKKYAALIIANGANFSETYVLPILVQLIFAIIPSFIVYHFLISLPGWLGTEPSKLAMPSLIWIILGCAGILRSLLTISSFNLCVLEGELPVND